ncbi:hypothetical protein [Zooshikella sp. RANM57]|uniref:hypothetical protein n=1 Tax=Zooshikella sp. RANM57 TaxID=3425863 RepID=UPI003D6E8EC4
MKFLAFLVIFVSCSANSAYVFNSDGNVNDVPVTVNLSINDAGKVTGHYFYKRIGKPIGLVGTLKEKDLKLFTTKESGINEKFVGYASILDNQIVQIKGKWQGRLGPDTSLSGKKVDAHLKATSLNIFEDKTITCHEMRSVPEIVFADDADIDLGSGYRGFTDIEDCRESLANISFLENLNRIATNIRSEKYIQGCTGTIYYAHYRYFKFSLQTAGFWPPIINVKAKASPKIFSFKKNATFDYLYHWSLESPYNYRLYTLLLKEINQSIPRLTQHYMENFNYSAPFAKESAENAIMLFVDWAAGTYSENNGDYSFSSKNSLIKLKITEKTTLPELKSLFKQLDSDEHIEQILRASLVLGIPKNFIQYIINNGGSQFLNSGNESLLTLTLDHPEILVYLINAGAKVDLKTLLEKHHCITLFNLTMLKPYKLYYRKEPISTISINQPVNYPV